MEEISRFWYLSDEKTDNLVKLKLYFMIRKTQYLTESSNKKLFPF